MPPSADDNQPSVEDEVALGGRPTGRRTSRSASFFKLTGLPAGPCEVGRKIEVTFDIDAKGIVQVHAKDQAPGKDVND